MATPLSRRLHFILLICGELVSGQIHYSIPEELEHGAFVGNIAEDLGLSIREMTGRKFKLVYDDGMQLLKVNMGNGILFVNQRIDREFLCGQSSTCSVSLDVALENPLEMHRVNVEILDVNDNSPSFAKNRYYLQVSEVTAVGAFFRLDSAHDPDVGSNCVNIYKISTNKHFGLKTHTRSDGSKIAELVLETPLDREKHSTIHVTLTAFDGGIPHRSGNAEIIITVLDFNDNTPVFDHKIYSVNIMENAPVGHLVLTINATDLDEGANGEVKYILRSDANQRVQELFRLDPISGQIRVQGSLDYEEKRIYELEVEAVDNGTPILTARAEILVELIDVNDNPPELKISSLSRKVREDAAFGSVVAIISVIDQDSGANGQVQCQLPPNIPFKLQKSFNNQYKLVISDKLDREMTPYYNICISAWDAGSPRLSTKRTILVSISDINDNVPRFTQASYNVFLMENNIPGTSIFAVTAFDPDLDKNSKLSYFLLEYRREDVSRSGDVTVNSETGHIYALRSFDYEIRKEIQIKIQAQDAGTPPLSSTAIVNIVILDQNDNAPVIIAPSKYNSSTAMEVVPMSAYPGYLVTKVIATDADSGQNARLSYQLVEATDRNMFSVGITSGEIRTTRRFRDHDVPIQKVLILVKDKGQPSLSSMVTIVISVLPNVTENFSERKNTPRNPGLFSDTNLLLILCFGLTSSIFLLIICFLIALKCKQDRNVYGYTFGTCCSRQRNSTDAFHGRSVPKANLSYPETPAPIRDSYNYTVCLSPESAQSDFLFLKSCHPTLPLDEINVVDRGK